MSIACERAAGEVEYEQPAVLLDWPRCRVEYERLAVQLLDRPDPVLSAYGRQVDSCTGPEARALLAALVAAHGGEGLDEWRRRFVG